MFNVGTIAKRLASGLSVVGVTSVKVNAVSPFNVTATEPSGTQQNDILVAYTTGYDSSKLGLTAVNAPSGWSSAGGFLTADGFGRLNFYHIRRGASAPSLVFPVPDSSSGNPIATVTIFSVRGVSPGLAIGSVIETATHSNPAADGAGSIPPVNITALGSNRLLLHFAVRLFTETSGGAPTGTWVESFDSPISGTGPNIAGTFDYALQASSGTLSGRTTIPDTGSYHFVSGLSIRQS